MDGYMAFNDGWTSQGGCRFCFEQSYGRLGESFYAMMIAGGLQSLGSSGADAEILKRVGQAVSSRLLLSLPLSILMLSSLFPTSRSSRPCSTFSSHTEQFSLNVLPLPRWFCSISDGISFRSIFDKLTRQLVSDLSISSVSVGGPGSAGVGRLAWPRLSSPNLQGLTEQADLGLDFAKSIKCIIELARNSTSQTHLRRSVPSVSRPP